MSGQKFQANGSVLYFGQVKKLKRPVPLSELRMHSDGGLKGMQLLTQGRLSVQKVTPQEWDFILGLADQPPINPDGESPGASNKA